MSNLIDKGLLITRNGDRAVHLTTAGKLKTIHSGLKDLSTVNEMFKFKQDQTHLGMLHTFDALGTAMGHTNTIPRIMTDMLQKKAVINLEDGRTTFTYSTPITRYNGLKIMRTTSPSEANDRPGLDGTPFPIYLNKAMRQGDVLTYDKEDGIQIIVSEDYDIEPAGDMYKHYVKITQGAGDLYFPMDKLTAGTEYFKITHSMGEFSEDYSEFNYDFEVEELVQEFSLANQIGVATASTLYGAEKSMNGLSGSTKNILDKVLNSVNLFQSSTNKPYDMLVLLDNYVAGETVGVDGLLSINPTTDSVMSLFEAMAVSELIRLETSQMLWAKEGMITEINGYKRINEGLYTQMRRGNILTYAVPGGVDMAFLQKLSDSVFIHNLDMPVTNRRIKLRVGKGLAENLDFIKQNHGRSVLSSPAYQTLMGADKFLPKPPVHGDLSNLTVDEIRIGNVYLPGVGYLDYEHEPSLDYTSGQDRFTNKLYNSSGRSRSTYSGYLDVRDANATNVFSDPNIRFAQPLEGNSSLMASSVFYVKPRRSLHWGWEQGRMNSVSHLVENLSHISSTKSMTTEFWMHARSAAWIADKSAMFVVELERPRLTII